MNVGDRMLDQPRAPGGDGQTDLQVNRELFPEGELLLQVLCRSLVIWDLPSGPAIRRARRLVSVC